MRFSEIERAAACYNGAESGAERERGAFGGRRSRIARGRAQLRDALAHRAPAEGRERYQGVS